MKRLSLIIATVLFFSTLPSLAHNVLLKSLEDIGGGNEKCTLIHAFIRIRQLPNFEPLSDEEMDDSIFKELGETMCVVAPNSESRSEVIKILKEIPYELFYSEFRAKDDDIIRTYIETDSNGNSQMLYVMVGNGSADLLAAFCSGLSIDVYQKIGDKLKDSNYEEMQDAIVTFNSGCPMAIGPTSEITSMSINQKYWTVRMKVDTFENGISSEINNEEGKKRAMSVLKAFEKYNVSKLFNLRIDFKIVITTEKEDSYTLILTTKDIVDILNDEDMTPKQALEEYIENNKKACPLIIDEGFIMTDMKIIDNVLITEILVDEENYSIDLMRENRQNIHDNMANIISLREDEVLRIVADWLVKTNNGMGYYYIGNSSGQSVLIKLTYEELRELLNDE